MLSDDTRLARLLAALDDPFHIVTALRMAERNAEPVGASSTDETVERHHVEADTSATTATHPTITVDGEEVTDGDGTPEWVLALGDVCQRWSTCPTSGRAGTMWEGDFRGGWTLDAHVFDDGGACINFDVDAVSAQTDVSHTRNIPAVVRALLAVERAAIGGSDD